MVMTPEAKVKKKVTNTLKEMGCYYRLDKKERFLRQLLFTSLLPSNKHRDVCPTRGKK